MGITSRFSATPMQVTIIMPVMKMFFVLSAIS